MPRRRRLDEELVEQGFFASKDDAMRAVLAGEVSTSDRRLSAAGEQVVPGIELHVRGRGRFVSRGGLKLERALDTFAIAVDDLRCLDVGCSTGGFTDCLLKRGAAHVVAVDVGRAQFSWELRQDERVELLERTNACELPSLRPDLVGTIDLAVSDVSFTSVLTVLPAMLALLGSEGHIVMLVKPQFEAPREDVGAGGIVRDPAVRAAAVDKVKSALEEAGLSILGCCESPITGHKGNVEYLLAATVAEGSPLLR